MDAQEIARAITLTEAARMVRRSRSAVVKACISGRLPRHRGNDQTWRVNVDDLLRVFGDSTEYHLPPDTDKQVQSQEIFEELGALRERCNQQERQIADLREQHAARIAEQAEQHTVRMRDVEAERDRAWQTAEDWRRAWELATRPWWRRILG